MHCEGHVTLLIWQVLHFLQCRGKFHENSLSHVQSEKWSALPAVVSWSIDQLQRLLSQQGNFHIYVFDLLEQDKKHSQLLLHLQKTDQVHWWHYYINRVHCIATEGQVKDKIYYKCIVCSPKTSVEMAIERLCHFSQTEPWYIHIFIVCLLNRYHLSFYICI